MKTWAILWCCLFFTSTLAFTQIDSTASESDEDTPFVLYCMDASEKHVAIGTSKKVMVLEVETGKLVYEFHPGKGYITSVDFSKDGRYLLTSGGSYTEGYLESWDLKKGKSHKQFSGHTQYVWKSKFSDDDKKVLSVGFDKQFFTFSAQTAEALSNLETEAMLYDIGEISDGYYFLGGGYMEPYSCVVEAGELKKLKPVFHYTDRIESVCISPDKRWALSGDLNGRISIWDLVNLESIKKLETPAKEDYHNEGICNMIFSPDNRTLLVSSRDGKISFWNWSTGLLLQEWTGFTDAIYGLAVSHDNSKVFVGEGFSGKVYCKDFNTGKVIWEQKIK